MLQVVKMFSKKTKIQKLMVELIYETDKETYYVVGTWFYKDGTQIFQSNETKNYAEALTTYMDKVLEYNQLKDYQQTHWKWS